ncbi:hypothetical protein [Sphingomonas sp. ERG5]|uniref:hypothetical protein n=1 Tax=Sphingomonas sp. ERG5 TaxID=1381597 RepID=UPI00054B6556|nr:hypothetical protein [Sphingomonas sp. ERG5]
MTTGRMACVAAALFGLAAASAASAQSAGQSLSQDDLTALGFKPTTEQISADSYVQLRVAAYIPNSLNQVTLDRCPKDQLWGFNLKKIARGDTHQTLGLRIDLPNAPSVTLDPLDFSRKSGGLFQADSCTLTVDAVRYRSPLYFVRRSPNRQFVVSPTLASSNALSQSVRSGLQSVVGLLTSVSGVPAVAAAPYLATIKTTLDGADVSSDQTFVSRFEIEPGPVEKEFRWVIPGAITGVGRNAAALDIVLIAQVVPVATIIPAPTGNVWTTGTVLNSAFNFAGTDDATLGSYLTSYASTEIINYTNANSAEAAELACGSLAQKIDTVGLSDRDGALALWAQVQRRVSLGKAERAEVDNMACMETAWASLAPLGIARTPKTPPPPPPPVTRAPTVMQMKAATDIDQVLPLTFTSAAWSDQKPYAQRLFAYPLTLNDASALMTRGSGTITSVDGWLINEFDRDRPLLNKIGCFAYFDIAADKTGYAAGQGSRSLVLAVGELGGGTNKGKEVALQLSFGAVTTDGGAQVEQIDVLPDLSTAARSAMRLATGSSSQCRSGYAPNLLFGSP